MGHGASTLPDTLKEKDLEEACGEKYDRILFASLKDRKGLISRDEFLGVVQQGKEQEVYNLFISYCDKEGQMDINAFISLLRDAKFLNKHNFSSHDATHVFNSTLQEDTSTINYHEFRRILIPLLAPKKGYDDVDQVMIKFAELDIDEINSTKLSSEKYTGIETTDPVQNAAIKIQKLQRRNNSRKLLYQMKELQSSCRDDVQNTPSTHPAITSTIEQQFHIVFDKYADSSHRLSCSSFVKLCIDKHIVSKTLTKSDCKHIFKLSVAKAKNVPTMKNSIFFSKYITFEVFITILLEEISFKSNKSIENIIEYILSDVLGDMSVNSSIEFSAI